MKKYDITLTLVTPCISRGGDPTQAEFRAPSIRGMLRHWFRVLGGTKSREKEVFGGLGTMSGEERASRIIVRVKKAPEQANSAIPEKIAGGKFDYFLGLWKGDEEKAYFPENQSIEIQIVDKTDSPDFENALKAFLYLGALGSRSRRTYGSIYPSCVRCNGSEWTDIPQTLEAFREYLKNSGLKNSVVLSLGERTGTASAVSVAKDFLKSFRCGSSKSGTPSRWGKAEHDLIAHASPASRVFRPALGLPLIQRYSNGKGTFQFSQKNGKHRWASPLYLKILPLNGKFVPLAIFLKDYVLPENTVILRKNQEFQLSHDLINAMMNPEYNVKTTGIKTIQLLP